MALSRLENFLKSSRGKILHVNPENLDSSDSIQNDGASPFTPFKTINRALLEASRYSYQVGLQNDRFNFCTILLYSGEHYIDNRPGAVIDDSGAAYLRNGSATNINQFDLTTVLDLNDPTNNLYLLNSVYGGVIVPRGTSIVAQDLRKTIIRPLYVPDPKNNNIERSAIFRVTGASFFFSFSILDAIPSGFCYKNYNPVKFTPNFSHHKLTAFEYVDGVNDVNINDGFLNVNTTRTDLDQYYEKISLVYGASSGREIDNVSYIGGVSVDIQPVIDEFRIVGPRGDLVGISSIISGDGITPSSQITVTLDQPVEGISVDTSIQISGVNVTGYDGQFVVSAVPTPNQVQYITPTIPTITNPTLFGATLNIISDTISSASPYIFNVSMRSVYGMCGLHADGSKVEGFKSVVVAQFTAISLQKDNDAFIVYDEEAGTYLDSTVVPDLYKNTRSRYKPEFENFHIKVSNDAFSQLVSVFSIGFAAQIVAESGGDYSITNSNSNFGSKTFISDGFKPDAFDQDDHGFIVGVIPPEEIEEKFISLEFPQVDIGLTTSVSAGAATTNKLYFYNETNLDSPPVVFVDGFRLGAKKDDELNIEFPFQTSSKIVIPKTNSSYEKAFFVQRQNNGFENSITNGQFTLTQAHSFEPGEKVRVFSQDGHLPDGVDPDRIYYIIESSIDGALSNAQVKLATTLSNAINNVPILPNRKGGKLYITSRVSDKMPNDPGHPVQWDSNNNNWYVSVSETDNGIYSSTVSLGSSVTGRTFIKRTQDTRVEENKLYKLLYSIPKDTATSARPPVNGFIIQETNDSTLSGSQFERYFGVNDLTSSNEVKNPKFISSISWSSNEVTVTTELPHKFTIGSTVEIINVIPDGYNGVYTITRVPSSRSFVYSLATNPGIFSNDTRVRNSNLPYVKRKNTKNIFQIYKSEEIQKYIKDKQDGLYELTVVHNSVSPTITPFTRYNFSQPVKNLYPQLDRDNPDSDPNQTVCFADHNIIGNIIPNDPQDSISREAFTKLNHDLNVGVSVTSIISSQTGISHTIFTNTDHGLSGITSVSIVSVGASYVAGTYYGVGVTTTSGGNSASLKVVVDGTRKITSVDIMSGGSNYSVGNIISVVSGIGTTTGFVPATLSVTAINNPVNRTISLAGFTGDYSSYNDTYVIQSTQAPNRILVSSTSNISGFSTTLVSTTGAGYIDRKVLPISGFTYNNVTGISAITFSESHGLKVNSKVRLQGFNSAFYNKDVIITSVRSLNQIEVKSGISTVIPPTTGTPTLIPLGINPILGVDRIQYYYAGITTISEFTLNSDDPDNTPFNIKNAQTTGLKQGDYLEVNGEIFKIKSTVSGDFVNIFRGLFGTDRRTHPANSVVNKINIIPIELRRNSIIRASGHTFEYVGYGAGNYSTSLPENQDRDIGKVERLISQATRYSGGTIYYTGMDENGDFYSANRKLSSSTGEQEIYDLPAPTVVGETTINDSFNVIDSEKLIASGSIQVDGGENNDIISTFNGPVLINKKLTSYSEEGIEAPAIFLKGDLQISRRYSIDSDIPEIAGNYGDIVYNATPQEEGNIGWVYTTNDEWRTWGFVGDLGTNLNIFSESETGEDILEGIVNKLKFAGDQTGFDINVDVQVDQVAGFGTVRIKNPISPINFRSTVLGRNTPKFTNRSSGSRVIYYDSLNSNNVDYATGISTDALWNSVPRNTNQFSFDWYGGETKLMSLSGTGQLNVLNNITANLIGDVTGNASTATTATNLSRSIIAGAGLTGGGLLNADRTLTVNGAINGGIQVNASSIQVDGTVVRTTGTQSIGGVKTFTNTILSSNITASGIVTASTFVGNGTIPIGGIIMWSGTIANIPSGWALCNGANNTPNLRDRFIVGAGNNYTPGNTGGADTVTLTLSQLPAHTHTASTNEQGSHTHTASTNEQGSHTHTGTATNGGAHTHTGTAANGGTHTHAYTRPDGTISFNVGPGSREAVRRGETDRTDSHTGHTHTLEIVGAPNHTHPLSIVSNGAHTHTVSIVSNGAHTHTVTVGSAGEGSAHENRPPYYALAFIMRIS